MSRFFNNVINVVSGDLLVNIYIISYTQYNFHKALMSSICFNWAALSGILETFFELNFKNVSPVFRDNSKIAEND